MRVLNVTTKHDDVNGHSSGFDHTLDEELGIPSVITPGVRKLHAENRALGNNAQPCRSKRNREAAENVKWQEAMNVKMDALYGNEACELVPMREGNKPIGCRWVYKVKHNSDDSVSKYKANFVAKGYAQIYGIDYEDTFAPIAKMTTVRAAIAVATAKGWILH
ncbi:hypothetical protein L7F22_026227 [Adiantum nelumboides]|nr:hypothetical protein [Adiantum nelumboides]